MAVHSRTQKPKRQVAEGLGLIKKLKARQATVACRAFFDDETHYDTFGESACERAQQPGIPPIAM